MKLDLKPLARQPGQSLPFACRLELSEDWQSGAQSIISPVQVEGVVRNMAGALLLSARLESTLSLTCDRCATSFSRQQTTDYETLLAMELEDEERDDIVLLDKDGCLNLSELMREVFLLNMDTKNLCSDHCKGLCPGCGVDLNRQPCRCKREMDPRLSVLARLLEQEN